MAKTRTKYDYRGMTAKEAARWRKAAKLLKKAHALLDQVDVTMVEMAVNASNKKVEKAALRVLDETAKLKIIAYDLWPQSHAGGPFGKHVKVEHVSIEPPHIMDRRG